MIPDIVEVLDCVEPIEALESDAAIFVRCWDCDEIINSDVFPVCDDCMIRRGPFRSWCCKDEDRTAPAGSIPVQLSHCWYNLGYLGRYDVVFHRRALTA